MNIKALTKHSPLVLLAACSLVLNVALSARVLRLQQKVEALTPIPAVKLGTRVGPVVGKDMSGKPVTLDPRTTKGTVLYVFAPDCGWCRKNSDNIRVVAQAAARRGMTVYAVSLADKGVPEFLRDHNFDVPVLMPSAETKKAYGMGGTPQTIVMSADGAVIRNWKGAFVNKTAADVESFFSIQLPGLPAAKP